MRAFLRLFPTLLIGLLLPRLAFGYCLTRTCELDPEQPCAIDPETGCVDTGAVLHWERECLSFAAHVEGSLLRGISADEVSALVSLGFATWSGVSCAPGLTPDFGAAYRGSTECAAVEYVRCAGDDNSNVVLFQDEQSHLDLNTIALTSIIANLSTGEILDADIEVNSRAFDFAVDAVDSGDSRLDLRLVLNHELGHFLGLSHSFNSDSLMHSAYFGRGLDPVNPVQDDVDAVCAVYPTAANERVCDAPPVSDRCAQASLPCPVVLRSRGADLRCTVSGGVVGGRAPLPGRWVLSLALGLFCFRRQYGQS